MIQQGRGAPRTNEKRTRRHLAELEKKRQNWESAIEKGYNIERAIEKIEELDHEAKALEAELALAGTRQRLDADVHAVSEEIMANLGRLEEVLQQGSVAEVKAILRAYIGRTDYDPEKNKARVGFLRMPTRALVSRLAPESARISVVAGARYEAEETIPGTEIGFRFDRTPAARA